MNIRHDLDPADVLDRINKKIARWEQEAIKRVQEATDHELDYQRRVAEGTVARYWARRPDSAERIDAMYEDWIKYEQEHYSHVRVIELPQPGKRFILVYGVQDDMKVTEGTGPFATLDDAKNWFLNQGR